ncbi:MAG TPA: polysaccharide biosynthesis/export family protein [Polyangiaceae bacterium]|nr:polysaccharide biosynthesis/export family protein [Polyangiaceae bacterium]
MLSLSAQSGGGALLVRARAWCFMLAVAAASGCGSHDGTHVQYLPAPSDKTVVGAGDIFTMQIVSEKDLPSEYQVASDGTVDLPYVHTIQVAGLEPQEIARLVRQKLIDGKILTNPIVVVQVKEYRSRAVILLGQVARPGSFPLTPGLTLMQAISLAGGLSQIANDDNVTLTRKLPNGSTTTVTISVDAITEGHAPDVPLQAGDRVYVHERLF